MELEGQNIYTIDIEADNLYPYQKNVWVICVRRYGCDDQLLINPSFKGDIRQTVLDYVFRQENPILIAHNGIGYDFWVLWKEFGMDFNVGPDTFCGRSVSFFDTLYASQYFLPDRIKGHALKSWGERYGDEKIDFRKIVIEKGIIEASAPKGEEYKVWIPEMDEYCEKDCIITERIFSELYTQLVEEDTHQGFRLGQKNFFLMAAQGFTGVLFDREFALELQPKIESMMLELRNEVDPKLPLRTLKKSEEAFYKIPKNILKKDGDYSATFIKWLDKHQAEVVGGYIEAYGNRFAPVPDAVLEMYLPMSIDDQKQLKEYFLSIGWIPSMWNFKKDVKGKPIRGEDGKLITTSPKIQENGNICANLMELSGELPPLIVKYLSIKNRAGILKGWLNNERLDFDRRLSATSTGIASTHRQKHATVVNVPKAQDDTILGKEFRSLFIVDKGNKLVGCDQAALEARVQGHWTFPYDDGETARELLLGDPHAKNAKAFFPEETKDFDVKSPDFDKEHPIFKPFRSKSKNGQYAIMYGCAAPKLASTLGLPESRGGILLERFWEANQGLKNLKDKVEEFWLSSGNKEWIPGVDGRRLYSRSQHSLINLLFQSTGAIIVDYALALFDQRMGGLTIDEMGRPYYNYKGMAVKRVLYVHDEFQVEVPEELVEEVSEIMEWCMSEAGIRLELRIALEGDASVGNNWKETH